MGKRGIILHRMIHWEIPWGERILDVGPAVSRERKKGEERFPGESQAPSQEKSTLKTRGGEETKEDERSRAQESKKQKGTFS